MRDLNECREEIFRRSEERIKVRRRNRNRVMACCVPLCLIVMGYIAIMFTTQSVSEKDAGYVLDKPSQHASDNTQDVNSNTDTSRKDDELTTSDIYSFSLTWGCYGISSYDSKTGRLVKTTDATNPEEYVTDLQLSAKEYEQICELIRGLDVTSYPDEYNPHEDGPESSPSMTLILTVQTETFEKTIRAKDIALTFEADNEKGRAFLNVCEAIRDILIATDEWKSLPDYEFLYE